MVGAPLTPAVEGVPGGQRISGGRQMLVVVQAGIELNSIPLKISLKYGNSRNKTAIASVH